MFRGDLTSLLLLLGLVACGLESASGATAAVSAQSNSEIDSLWILSCGFLVVFMQAGFTMLEAGSISSKHIQNIVFKNFLDMTAGSMIFFLIGYGFAFGDSVGGFIGGSNFAMIGIENNVHPVWFFQFAFASVATTIVSGAMAL